MSRIRTLFLGINIEKDDVDKQLDPTYAPSLFDYDIVIADVDVVLSLHNLADRLPVENPITYGQGAKALSRLNQKLYQEAFLLLSKGGLLVCLLKPVRGFEYETREQNGAKQHYITNYGWIPIPKLSSHPFWKLYYGRGNRVLLTDVPSAFSSYLKMKETFWMAYFDDVRELKVEVIPLATNDAGLPISLEVPIGKGWLIFLPVSSHPKFAEILLECATRFLSEKRLRARPPPEWLKDYMVLGEKEKIIKINELNSQIESFQTQLNKQIDELKDHTEIKKLLYEGDEALENVVQKAFKELGFSLSKKDDMDWISSSNVGAAILEVTGSESSIDIDKLRQLLNYLLTDYKETKLEKKAILVGNHFINDPPESRGAPFTEKVLKEADTHSICLLTTTDLFNAICSIREGKTKAADIRQEIMKATGLYSFN